jgi:hypothetical protein
MATIRFICRRHHHLEQPLVEPIAAVANIPRGEQYAAGLELMHPRDVEQLEQLGGEDCGRAEWQGIHRGMFAIEFQHPHPPNKVWPFSPATTPASTARGPTIAELAKRQADGPLIVTSSL